MLPPIQHPHVTFGTLLAQVAVSEMLHGVGFERSPWIPAIPQTAASRESPPRETPRLLQTRARLVRT